MPAIKISSKVDDAVRTELKEFAGEPHQSISGVLTNAIAEHLERRRVRPEVLRHQESSIEDNRELGRRLAGKWIPFPHRRRGAGRPREGHRGVWRHTGHPISQSFGECPVPPTDRYSDDLAQTATALFESLILNRPFLRGTKRVAFFATDVFLRLNGKRPVVDAGEAHLFLVDLLSQGPVSHGPPGALDRRFHGAASLKMLPPAVRAGALPGFRRAAGTLPPPVSKGEPMPERCPWTLGSDALMCAYHDEEWGVPLHDDRKLFEFLVLESAQAGLSWRTILAKREGYRRAFAGFDPEAVARFTDAHVARLVEDASIIRNRQKIRAAIANARAFLGIVERHNSFDAWIWAFVDGRSIQNRWRTLEELPTLTPLSTRIAKEMKTAGFSFLGPTTVYAHMQATGMVNDHVVSCFRHPEVAAMA